MERKRGSALNETYLKSFEVCLLKCFYQQNTINRDKLMKQDLGEGEKQGVSNFGDAGLTGKREEGIGRN